MTIASRSSSSQPRLHRAAGSCVFTGRARIPFGDQRLCSYTSLLSCCAGRMQDNEPLMRALSNLITVNDPDLVLFVGEALVRGRNKTDAGLPVSQTGLPVQDVMNRTTPIELTLGSCLPAP